MPRSKEIQEHENKIVDIYQSGKGYKAISKALGLQRTMVRAIIHKWRKCGTVVNLPRSEWLAYQNYSKSTMTTHPGGHKRTQNNI